MTSPSFDRPLTPTSRWRGASPATGARRRGPGDRSRKRGWAALDPVQQERRRELLRSLWTPEMRVAARERAERQYQAWRTEHPEWDALVSVTWAPIRAGETPRPTCWCGDRAKPVYDWSAMAVIGWACRKHRTNLRTPR